MSAFIEHEATHGLTQIDHGDGEHELKARHGCDRHLACAEPLRHDLPLLLDRVPRVASHKPPSAGG